MRLVLTLALLCGSISLAQPPKEKDKEPDFGETPPPRYGVPYKKVAYPQETAKKSLASALAAIDKPDVPYLVAHLMDPGFVDLRVADRAKQIEPGVDEEFRKARDYQQANLDKFLAQDRLPLDKAKFRALVVERSVERAFKQVVKDVEDKLANDPLGVRDLRKMFRDGKVEDTETGAKITHADVKDRVLYFRKIGDRWFLENRQEESVAPPKKDEEKKEPEKKP